MKKTTIIILAAIAMLSSSVTTRRADSAVPKNYPLKSCVVSDDPLGEHGKPIKVTAPDGTDVHLCCKDCLKGFKKDPAKYAKLPRTPRARDNRSARCGASPV